MNEHSSKRKSEETAEAVEELDDALEALPGGADAGVGEEESSANPLSRVDVSGETSFESAEFESDEEAPDEDESEVVIHDADAEALARRARNARRHCLQAARHRSRNFRDTRRAIFLRHQDAFRQAPHPRQGAQGDGRSPDDVRNL